MKLCQLQRMHRLPRYLPAVLLLFAINGEAREPQRRRRRWSAPVRSAFRSTAHQDR